MLANEACPGIVLYQSCLSLHHSGDNCSHQLQLLPNYICVVKIASLEVCVFILIHCISNADWLTPTVLGSPSSTLVLWVVSHLNSFILSCAELEMEFAICLVPHKCKHLWGKRSATPVMSHQSSVPFGELVVWMSLYFASKFTLQIW